MENILLQLSLIFAINHIVTKGLSQGRQQHNRNFKEQYHKGRQKRINGGKQSRVIHGKVTETGIMLRMSAGAKQDFTMSVSVKAA